MISLSLGEVINGWNGNPCPIERFLGQVRVTEIGQAKEQVVGVLPDLDDNPFENDIVDHGSLL